MPLLLLGDRHHNGPMTWGEIVFLVLMVGFVALLGYADAWIRESTRDREAREIVADGRRLGLRSAGRVGSEQFLEGVVGGRVVRVTHHFRKHGMSGTTVEVVAPGARSFRIRRRGFLAAAFAGRSRFRSVLTRDAAFDRALRLFVLRGAHPASLGAGSRAAILAAFEGEGFGFDEIDLTGGRITTWTLGAPSESVIDRLVTLADVVDGEAAASRGVRQPPSRHECPGRSLPPSAHAAHSLQ